MIRTRTQVCTQFFKPCFSGYYSLCSYLLNSTTNTIYSIFALVCCWIILEYIVHYQLRQGDANKHKDIFILKLTGRSISPDLNIMNIVSKVFLGIDEKVPPLSCHDCCYLRKGPLIYFGPWTRSWQCTVWHCLFSNGHWKLHPDKHRRSFQRSPFAPSLCWNLLLLQSVSIH